MIDKNKLLQSAYCSGMNVLDTTENLCRSAIERNIPGDFAEAGVGKGVHPILMSQFNRPVHLFDSFEGIPIHGDEDIEWTEHHGRSVSDQRKTSGITSHGLNEVKEYISSHTDISKCVFHKGWFIDTFACLSTEVFSVLRLDCDLYESYKLCFEHLLPRLSNGGYLIIDDYTLSGCKKAISEYLPHADFNTVRETAWTRI
jgi:hypothetical protein